MLPLLGKCAIVTGASGGIGRAVALRLAKDGASVVALSRSQAKAEEMARSLPASRPGQSHIGLPCDVRDSSLVNRAVDAALERTGRIHILVNAAGVSHDALLTRLTDEQLDDMMGTNLLGSIYMCRAVVKPLLRHKEGGSIINIASVIGGRLGSAGQTGYAATKAGVIGLTTSLARELGKRGIRVNALSPGFIRSPMTEAAFSQQEEGAEARIIARTALARLGNADEVAGVVSFLASEDARFITGQVIGVDGGIQ